MQGITPEQAHNLLLRGQRLVPPGGHVETTKPNAGSVSRCNTSPLDLQAAARHDAQRAAHQIRFEDQAHTTDAWQRQQASARPPPMLPPLPRAPLHANRRATSTPSGEDYQRSAVHHAQGLNQQVSPEPAYMQDVHGRAQTQNTPQQSGAAAAVASSHPPAHVQLPEETTPSPHQRVPVEDGVNDELPEGTTPSPHQRAHATPPIVTPRGGRAGKGESHRPVLADGRSIADFNEADKIGVQRASEHDLPPGPIAGDDEALLAALRAATTNPATMGGSFGVRKGGDKPPNTRRGRVKRINCDKYDKHECRWQVAYELTHEGWYYKGCHLPGNHNGHSHELPQDTASVRAHRSGQFIPAELSGLAADVGRSLPAPAVHQVLKSKASELRLPVTWDKNMIYDTFVRDRLDDSYDLSESLERLATREREDGLAYFMKTIPADRGTLILDRLFVELEEAMAEWARGGEENVLLFDPTARTNKLGMALCPFVTVGPTGQTVILAFVLLNSQDQAHFEWSFKCFHTVFKVRPAVLVTDEDAAIRAATDSFSSKEGVGWHGTYHQFCLFHISKNFWKHISPVFGADRSTFHAVTSEFWRISKHTDERSRNSFNDEWEELVKVVATSGSGAAVIKAVTWLRQLAEQAPRFAYRFTWSRLTYLIHSTVRSEAINSALKEKALRPNMKLVQVIDNLVEYNREARELKKADMVRMALRQLGSNAPFPPWVRSVPPRSALCRLCWPLPALLRA